MNYYRLRIRINVFVNSREGRGVELTDRTRLAPKIFENLGAYFGRLLASKNEIKLISGTLMWLMW